MAGRAAAKRRPTPPAADPAADARPEADLSVEIEMLRRVIHMLVQMATENSLDPVRALEAISSATNRLAQIVAAQAQLHGGEDEVRAALYLALEACWNEIRSE